MDGKSLNETARELETQFQNERTVNALRPELTQALTEAIDFLTEANELLAKRYAGGDGKSIADKLGEEAKKLIQESLENQEATPSSELPGFDNEHYAGVVQERGSVRRGRPKMDALEKKPTEEELIDAMNLLEKLDGEFVRYARDRLETLLDEAATWEEAREAAKDLAGLQSKSKKGEKPKHRPGNPELGMEPERKYAGVLQDLREASKGEQWLEGFFATNEKSGDGELKKELVEEMARKAVGQATKELKGLVDGASGKKPSEKLDETAKAGIQEALARLKKFQTTRPSGNRAISLAGGTPNCGNPRYQDIARKHDETIGAPLRDTERIYANMKAVMGTCEMVLREEEAELRKLRSTVRTPLETTGGRPDQIGLVILGGDDRELRALEARIADLRALRDKTRRVLEKLADCLRAYRADHDA